jgi:hypothetical protein
MKMTYQTMSDFNLLYTSVEEKITINTYRKELTEM